MEKELKKRMVPRKISILEFQASGKGESETDHPYTAVVLPTEKG